MNFLLQALIYLALSVVSTVVQSIAQQDIQADNKQAAQGVRGTLQFGGDLSPRFILGRYGTGGQLRYGGYWGNSGRTPNAYLSRAIEVSCLPVRGFSGWFVFGERVTLAEEKTGDLGYAVLEYRKDGKDYLWINPYLGDQTAEDPLMLAKFGDHPSRPYAGMIGRGCGMFIVTARANRTLFPKIPEVMAEVDGIALDDPRGEDGHANPIAAIHTLMKGLSYDGSWIYGPQGISSVNFRAANLEEEADKCDLDLDGRPQFTCGLDIALDEEPHTVIGELLKACAGRWADLGGVYRFLVGAPGDPVVSFTDDDLVITEEQTFDPFPGLESLHNAMSATYPEPDQGWQYNEAPPRYNAGLEADDDNRRLPFSTQYKAVSDGVQVQHLMRLALEEARRFRKHTQTMPPEWWEYEPLDVAAWTSARNGYVTKSFLITMQEDLPTANQFVGLQEIDPADYGWESDYELPWDVAPLVIARPEPQPITGFAVEPYTGVDNADAPRRPGFRIYGYGAGLIDVREVWVQARLAETTVLILDGRAPYDPDAVDPSASWAGDPLLRSTAYEVRARLVPFSGRDTLWSAWLTVTTPNVRLGEQDVELAAVARDVLDQMGFNPRALVEQFKQLGTLLEEADRENFTERKALHRSISAQLNALSAGFDQIIEVAVGPNGAISQRLESLYAAMGGGVAEANVRWQAVASPLEGYSVRYVVQLRAGEGDIRAATFFGDVPADPSQPTRWGFLAGQFVNYTSAGVPLVILDENGVQRSANGAKMINWVTGAERNDAV